MKVFSHVGNTWLLAQFIHPLIFFCFFSFVLHDPPDIGLLVSLLLGAAVLSLPSLVLCFLFIRIIPVQKVSDPLNLIIWLVLVVISIFFNISLLALLMGDSNLLLHELDFFLPALAAAIVSVIIRYKNFKDFITLQKENGEDQNDIAGFC